MLASEAREKHQKAVCARTRLTITVDQVRSTHEPVPCGEPAPFVWVAASQHAKAIISKFSPAIRCMMSHRAHAPMKNRGFTVVSMAAGIPSLPVAT